MDEQYDEFFLEHSEGFGGLVPGEDVKSIIDSLSDKSNKTVSDMEASEIDIEENDDGTYEVTGYGEELTYDPDRGEILEEKDYVQPTLDPLTQPPERDGIR